MLVKIHSATRYVVAICDDEVFGKKFEEGIRGLDMTGTFFKGDFKTEEEVEEIMKDMVREDASFNVVGEKACQIAVKTGLVEEEGIFRIDGIPIALTLL